MQSQPNGLSADVVVNAAAPLKVHVPSPSTQEERNMLGRAVVALDRRGESGPIAEALTTLSQAFQAVHDGTTLEVARCEETLFGAFGEIEGLVGTAYSSSLVDLYQRAFAALEADANEEAPDPAELAQQRDRFRAGVRAAEREMDTADRLFAEFDGRAS